MVHLLRTCRIILLSSYCNVCQAKAIVQPLLDEAMDMKLMTAGSFEDRKERRRGSDGEIDTDESGDE